FLTRLTLIFENTRDSGSVLLTVKKLKKKDSPPCVLVRVVVKKKKFSTESLCGVLPAKIRFPSGQVSNNDVASFNERLFVAYRSQCTALKKKIKNRGKKTATKHNQHT
ncbi:hypothetical protein SARC_09991, partial [Sphaeroforma arctica JP610]